MNGKIGNHNVQGAVVQAFIFLFLLCPCACGRGITRA